MKHQTGNSGCKCEACKIDTTPPQYPFALVHVHGGRTNWMLPMHESTTAWLKKYLADYLVLEEGESLRLTDKRDTPIDGDITEEHGSIYVRVVREMPPPEDDSRCVMS